ncbi:MAG: hypothetical protein JST00_31485 [Deltaproteobacteria bacterium]|nr:hypothetical protein [Deltaproteobacteria bacterium]
MNALKILASVFALSLAASSFLGSAGCAAPVDGHEGAQGDNANVAESKEALTKIAPADAPNHRRVGTSLLPNCDNEGNCVAKFPGTDVDMSDMTVYQLSDLGKDQKATVTNLSSFPVTIWVIQGLGRTSPRVLQPGASIDLTSIDNEWYSALLWSPVIGSATDNPFGASGAQLKVEVGSFTPAHTACNDACMDHFSACMQGCSGLEKGTTSCQALCEVYASGCLSDCSKKNP